MYYALVGSTLLELLLCTPLIWKLRSIIAPLSIVLTAFSFGWLFTLHVNIFSGILIFFSFYRIASILRISEQRIHPATLRTQIFRSSFWILTFQACTLALWLLFSEKWFIQFTWQTVLWCQIFVAALICIFTVKNIIKLRFSWPVKHYSDKELPSVTVAIPARNETPDLANCLDSLIGSDYPKLEILVLDDCSQDHTSDIIKRYAQSGVRFIHGTEPREHWLAKNQAYDQLAQAASGDYILFLGVDTRIGVKTIRSLVTLMLSKEKLMISVLPLRGATSFGRSFIQPMRYWWELALPRKLFNRPPVLSTCWFVKRSVVTGSGGFSAVSQSVLPEAYFAKKLINTNAYSFIRSSGDLLVSSQKSFRDQLDRAIRVRYPELHRRLELAALITVFELTFLLAPFGMLITAVVLQTNTVIILAAVACSLIVIAHLLILSAIAQPLTLASLVNFPIIIITELILGNISMLRYEFSTVDWKGRNICIPVMLPPAQQTQSVEARANLE